VGGREGDRGGYTPVMCLGGQAGWWYWVGGVIGRRRYTLVLWDIYITHLCNFQVQVYWVALGRIFAVGAMAE
jgi:hypothetical protein